MPKIPSQNGKAISPAGTAKPAAPNNEETQYVKNAIDHRFDKLTDLWRAMEAKLLGMQPPRQIVCCYKHEEGDDGEYRYDVYHYLGIQRIGGKWRVCHATVSNSNNPEPKDWKPINDCGIEDRKRAANHVESLEYQVVETGKTFIPELDEAIENLEKRLLGENYED